MIKLMIRLRHNPCFLLVGILFSPSRKKTINAIRPSDNGPTTFIVFSCILIVLLFYFGQRKKYNKTFFACHRHLLTKSDAKQEFCARGKQSALMFKSVTPDETATSRVMPCCCHSGRLVYTVPAPRFSFRGTGGWSHSAVDWLPLKTLFSLSFFQTDSSKCSIKR